MQVLIASIGAGASLVLVYFIIAQLIDGLLFPDVIMAFEDVILSKTGHGKLYQHYALLVVASVVAGFSERLVPDLLIRSEKEFNVKSTSLQPARG
jgi:hypothetical protein